MQGLWSNQYSTNTNRWRDVMNNQRVYIKDLGHKHLFVEAHIPKELFTQLIEDLKKNGFHVVGVMVDK
jgi:hypothetical protein